MTELLRLLLALVVAGLLGRAARPAWRNRGLALLVWRRIRPRHVVGSLGLLALVVSCAVVLLSAVPGMDWGLGRLLGLYGNAVFAPVEEAASRAASDGAVAGAADVALYLGIAAFLVLLLALFPWLAYVEERVFREGLEEATPAQEIWAALRFGLLHLVMLIPIGAALAVGVAGFCYGRLYRSAYRSARRRLAPVLPGADGEPAPAGALRRARTEAVLASTVWHTTFNSLIVVIALAGVLLELT